MMTYSRYALYHYDQLTNYLTYTSPPQLTRTVKNGHALNLVSATEYD